MTHPTLSPELQTSLDELSAAITTLRAQHDRALDTLNTMRVLLLCPMDAALKVSSLRAALDLYDRPMEQPTCGNCGDTDCMPTTCAECKRPIDACQEREGHLSATRHEPAMTISACVYCAPDVDGPRSQAERDGDA